MLDEMRSRLNGRVAMDITPQKSGANYEAHYINETTLKPIKLWQRIQI
jgi:hypothetical protein